jgi:hypothetical protein
LVKNDAGAIRPIAIGESLRRLAIRAVLRKEEIKEKVKALFHPSQLGVGTKQGADTIIHAVAKGWEDIKDDSRYGVVLVDFKNAFNLVNRQVMLDEVADKLPELLPLFNYIYTDTIMLNYNAGKVASTAGTQQGGPESPLGFSLVLNKLIREIKARIAGLKLNVWYLDDGTLMGTHEELRQAIEIIQQMGPELGLHINLNKTQVWCGRNEEVEFVLYPEGIQFRVGGGFKLLGSPIGDNDFCESHFFKLNEKIENLVETTLRLPDKQVVYILLKWCYLSPKFNFALRTCPTTLIPEGIRKFDETVQRAVTEWLGGVPLTQAQISQIRLPVNMGGLGISGAADIAAGAFLSSLTSSIPLQGVLHGIDDPDLFEPRAHQLELDMLYQQLPEQSPESLRLTLKKPKESQHDIGKLINEKLFEGLHQGMAMDKAGLARLLSCAGQHSGDWLQVTSPVNSYSAKLEMAPHIFVIAVKYRLGMRQYAGGADGGVSQCSKCGKQADIYGNHAASCETGHNRISKHDAIRNVVYRAAQLGLLGPRREDRNTLAGSSERPGDLILPRFIKGREAIADFGVTNPCTQTAINGGSWKEFGKAGEIYAKRKKDKYADRCAEINAVFVPLIVETHGCWTASSVQFLERIAKAHAMSRCPSDAFAATRTFFQEISVALQSINAEMILERDPHSYN